MITTTPGAAHYLSFSLILLPSLYFALRSLASFPPPPKPITINPSLAGLPPSSGAAERVAKIYPEDIFEGGSYVMLPYGRVRYWILGPEEGQKIVLIHGLTIPSIIWKDVVPQLVANNFRVLVYDLYGRGYSDAPNLTYDVNLYTTQLAMLMQYVGWKKAHIVGFSMGGGITASFATTFPHLTTGKIALIASVGLLDESDFSYNTRFMTSPFVQYLSTAAPIRYMMRRLASSEKSAESEPDPLREIVEIQSALLPGFNFAVSSSLRNGPVRGLRSAFVGLNSTITNVLLIWGTDDRSVPYKYATSIQEIIPPPKTKLVTIEGGDHDLPSSNPEVISRALLDFFKVE